MNKINIFIVDDNKIFSLTLKGVIDEAFKNLPVAIHLFETGETSLDKFNQLKPEVVILDYYLNGKSIGAFDGLQVLDKIKLNFHKTNVIMLTSNNHIDTALKSFHFGAIDYVIKIDNYLEKIIEAISKIFMNKEIALQSEMNAKQDLELVIAGHTLAIQKEEKEKWADELVLANVHTAEMEQSKFDVENKNKNYIDSLNYAKRIQQAKLPKIEEIYASIPKSFILFKPKDIVSGDFYFFHRKDQSIFIAAADCTGHGVPGAFLSMIGSEKLEEAILISENISEVLMRLNKGIKTSLRQSEKFDSTRDGMDIAICSLDFPLNLNTGGRIILKYSGANRPLWIIRNGQKVVEEIKATKKAIGGYTEDDHHFEMHEIELQLGDSFYIFSDGYADSFGGKDGKKLMTKNFKEKLLSIQHLSMIDQEKYLNDFIENWKGELEQVDDILVMGVRL